MAVRAADRLIANRYALKTGLRSSELGTVWHAEDRLLGREVVVREIVFPPWLAGAERRATQASVLDEAGAVARLNHPGVVTVFDVVADHDGSFIVTELVQAPSLADLVLAEGPLPPGEWPRSALRWRVCWRPPTAPGSSTATSSRPTFGCDKTGVCVWTASASSRSRVSQSPPRPPWRSARLPM